MTTLQDLSISQKVYLLSILGDALIDNKDKTLQQYGKYGYETLQAIEQMVKEIVPVSPGWI